jgi:hypothetical protein
MYAIETDSAIFALAEDKLELRSCLRSEAIGGSRHRFEQRLSDQVELESALTKRTEVENKIN